MFREGFLPIQCTIKHFSSTVALLWWPSAHWHIKKKSALSEMAVVIIRNSLYYYNNNNNYRQSIYVLGPSVLPLFAETYKGDCRSSSAAWWCSSVSSCRLYPIDHDMIKMFLLPITGKCGALPWSTCKKKISNILKLTVFFLPTLVQSTVTYKHNNWNSGWCTREVKKRASKNKREEADRRRVYNITSNYMCLHLLVFLRSISEQDPLGLHVPVEDSLKRRHVTLDHVLHLRDRRKTCVSIKHACTTSEQKNFIFYTSPQEWC